MDKSTMTSIQPGLIVLHGNQLEQLGEAVLQWTQQNPLSVLEPEIMIVQSNGVAEWLKIAMARRQGVCASAKVMLPARFYGMPTGKCSGISKWQNARRWISLRWAGACSKCCRRY
jgi:exonuclease V gamma subunit